jgi:hypothetical protein
VAASITLPLTVPVGACCAPNDPAKAREVTAAAQRVMRNRWDINFSRD